MEEDSRDALTDEDYMQHALQEFNKNRKIIVKNVPPVSYDVSAYVQVRALKLIDTRLRRCFGSKVFSLKKQNKTNKQTTFWCFSLHTHYQMSFLNSFLKI